MSRLLPLITYFVVSAVLACAAYVSANASAGARKFRNVILAKSGSNAVIGYQRNINRQFKIRTGQASSGDRPEQKSNPLSGNTLNSVFELTSPLLLDAFSLELFSPDMGNWKNPLRFSTHSPAFEIYKIIDIRSNPGTGPPSLTR